MTSRDEIIALAEYAGFDIEPADQYHDKDEVLDMSNRWITERIERLVEAAQRQAYERAAEVCERDYVKDPKYWEDYEHGCNNSRLECAAAIRALIEGDSK